MALPNLKATFLVIWLVVGLAVGVPAWGQMYPARPIKVIVPMQAGTAGDAITRIVAQKISENLGQPLVIENMPAAAGLIGERQIAHAIADGYTIGAMGDSILTVLPHLQMQGNRDPLADLEPVSLVALVTSVLVLHPSIAATSVNEFIALAKLRPGSLDYASGGVGSQQHMAMELFKEAAGIKLMHVPFRGASQAAMEVVSGRVPVMFVAMSIALPLIKDGRLRAIAVASKERSTLMPALPTVSESGMSGFVLAPWVALYAPNGTPKRVIDRLNNEVAAAIGDPGVRSQLLALGLEPEASTPEELGKRTRDENLRMGKLIRAMGIRQ
ncbi:MAG: tripartite tricarboxylate transporter substrate binding protein [Betaproteobacteria bacterium]